MKISILHYWLWMFSLTTAGLCYGFFGKIFGKLFGKGKKDDKNKDFFQNQSLQAISEANKRSPEEEALAAQAGAWRGLTDYTGKLPAGFVGMDTREDAARRRALEATALPTGIAAAGAPNAAMLALAAQDRANMNANEDAHSFENYIDENKRAAYGVTDDLVNRDYNRRMGVAGLYQNAYGQKLNRDQFAKQTGFWRQLGGGFANGIFGRVNQAINGAGGTGG